MAFEFSGEERSILEAIHARPREDAPRLSYADWLAQNGDVNYAEVIRLECKKPYAAVSVRNPDKPYGSVRFETLLNDDTARREFFDRRERLLPMVAELYRSARYELQRKSHYYEQHVRGLPNMEIKEQSAAYLDRILEEIGPLPRVDLFAETTEDLVEWVTQPIMRRVERFIIRPMFWDVENDSDCTQNSHYDAYWERNIPILAACPFIEHLEEIHPNGCHSTGAVTEKSRANMAMLDKLIGERTSICYEW